MKKQIASKPPVTSPALSVPREVTHADFWAAFQPFLASLGVDTDAILPEVVVGLDEITFRSGAPIEGVEPTSSDGMRDHQAAIWCWPVTVKIVR